ncbi:MAG: hypothetical protein EYC70_05160 [Planctomycetota bacterium]|nr:MAG: hypothetical protein EYC70_05160 [Planctomycetota bacterium]
MKTSKLLLLAAACVPGLVLAAAPADPAPDHTAGEQPCDAQAKAVLQAAQEQAEADFWLAVARCINDPEGPLSQCLAQAERERDEALELAEDQHQARLKLCAALGHGRYDPPIRPSEFSPDITNNYFPHVPGRTLVYEKTTAKGLEHLEVTALDRTVVIDGVECRAVRDVEALNGQVVEDTEDWFSQHRNGNVWYFGEFVLNYDEDGFVEDIDGSFRAGVDGAKPGILMLAAPARGDLYRQEFFINEAEDVGLVLSLNETVTVPYGTFNNCLQTLDGSPIEPDAREHKYYAPGIGLVLEVDLEKGERLELIAIR